VSLASTPFVREILSHALDSALDSMSTSVLAILSGLVFGIYRLVLTYRNEGWRGVSKSFLSEGIHAIIFGAAWWGLLFSYHLFVKVPRQIRKESASHAPPIPRHRIAPPDFAYQKTTIAIKHSETRTYLVFSDQIGFPRDANTETGQILPEHNFRIGDEIYFNFWYNASGPNPVKVFRGSRNVYLGRDTEESTQKAFLEHFKRHVADAWKNHPDLLNDYTPQYQADVGRFGSAFAFQGDSNTKIKVENQAQLSDLLLGHTIPFVIIEIPYKDNDTWHHLRTCQWVQPATIPGVWHICDVSFPSD